MKHFLSLKKSIDTYAKLFKNDRIWRINLLLILKSPESFRFLQQSKNKPPCIDYKHIRRRKRFIRFCCRKRIKKNFRLPNQKSGDLLQLNCGLNWTFSFLKIHILFEIKKWLDKKLVGKTLIFFIFQLFSLWYLG